MVNDWQNKCGWTAHIYTDDFIDGKPATHQDANADADTNDTNKCEQKKKQRAKFTMGARRACRIKPYLHEGSVVARRDDFVKENSHEEEPTWR